MLAYTSLSAYYRKIFSLVQHHKYSITELEDLVPYERDLYIDMLLDYLEDKKENNG